MIGLDLSTVFSIHPYWRILSTDRRQLTVLKSKHMKQILIVDDEPSLRSALSELLSEETDLTVFQAEHGVQALQILKDEKIDLMLLDVDMPFLNGAGVVAELAAKPAEYAQPEILILTNRGDMDMVSKMVTLKVFDYVIKSDHSLAEIVQMVRAKLA